ncbi:MAG: hypothetical protein LBG83_04870 [Oscillospiraceae bacterium]|nr:hypothetical protein [Oscillospiraceae bacterium]
MGYEEIIRSYVRKDVSPKLGKRKLALLLLESAFENEKSVDLDTVKVGGSDTEYRKGRANISPYILAHYSDTDKEKDKIIHDRVKLHFTDKVKDHLVSDKARIAQMVSRFRLLIQEEKETQPLPDKEQEAKRQATLGKLLELADREPFTDFLAEAFIYAVHQPNDEGKYIPPKTSPPNAVYIDSVDRLISSMEQSLSRKAQELKSETLASFMQIAASCMGLTSEAAEKYDSYEGPIENGVPHGSNGKAIYPDGRVYIGDWRFGKRHGHGTITLEHVSIITAPWQDDKTHGMAIIRFLTEGMENWEYRVSCVNGKPHGEGIMKNDDGETKIVLQVDMDKSIRISQGESKDRRTEWVLTPDGELTITDRDVIEDVHRATRIHGLFHYTGAHPCLRDGTFSVKCDNGETEISKGNFSLPDLELFGSGEVTFAGPWGKQQWHGIFREGKLNGYADITYEDGRRYEGFFVDDDRHGWGKLIDSAGNLVYAGQWKNGRRHGRGSVTFSDKSTYVGQWKKGRFHGRGERIYADQSKYEGEWRRGMAHGRGAMQYADGSSYVGQWKKGCYDGLGTRTDTDGNVVYVGVWRYDRIYGRGTCYRTDGTTAFIGESIDRIPHGRGAEFDEFEVVVYEGEYNNGHYNGHGTKWFPDEEKYVGQWKQGQRHGRGKMIWTHGAYTGEWQNDKPHGRGTFESTDGWVYVGEWANGDAHGLGIRIEADGTEFKGLFEHGEFRHGRNPDEEASLYKDESMVTGVPHGHGECLYPDFRLYKGTWKEGKRHGAGTMTYPDGTTIQGEWIDDNFVMPGRVVMRYSNGSSYEGGINSEGKFHGFGKHIEAGGTIRDGEWKEGTFTGNGEVTYESGAYRFGNWKNNKHDGPGLYIADNGQVMKGNWYDGKLSPDDFLIKIQPSGAACFGEMKNGLMHGLGRKITADGATLDATFHAGEMVSNGDMYFILPDGESYQGGFANGRPHGQGKRVLTDGETLIGSWMKEKFVGNGHCYIVVPCNHMYHGQMTNGSRNGYGVLTYLDGSEPYIQKGIWKNNVLAGKGELIYSDGISFRCLFQDGIAVGLGNVTWSDGCEGKGEYKDGKLTFYSQQEKETEKTNQ